MNSSARRWLARLNFGLAKLLVGLLATMVVVACGFSRMRPGVLPALAWRYAAEGAIDRPPLRVGDVLVFAPRGGPLTALDAESGTLRWQFDPPEGLWHRAFSADAGRVYIGLGDGHLVALNASSGAVLWDTELGINVQAPPRVQRDTLFAASTFVGPGLEANPRGQAKLFALDVRSGGIRWAFTTDNYILQTPYATDDTVYVGGSYLDPEVNVEEGGMMRLYALSAVDGGQKWVYTAEDGFLKALYATDTRVAYVAYQDYISGVDAQTGELVWRGDTGNWVPSLTGSGERIFFGAANTLLYAWDVTSGAPLWVYNIAGEAFNYALGAPVFQNGKIYLLSQRGDMIALDAADGRELWRVSTGIKAREGLSVFGEWLYIGDAAGGVYAYRLPGN